MKRKVILFIDDDELTLKWLDFMFVHKSLKILKASNGSEALKVLNKPNTKVDLIITNYKMPFINGVELANMIRTSNKFSNIPLLLTSITPNDNQILMQQHLFNKIIRKPFTSEFLLNEVTELLNK